MSITDWEDPIPFEDWMLEKTKSDSTPYNPPKPELTEDEEWIDNSLYRNCWENGWGMTEPSTKQLVQLCNDFKEFKNWQ